MRIAIALAVLVLQAQQPVFRAGVNFVELDVSVLDKDRRPVMDLTSADFTVLEDGVPQKVETFEAVSLQLRDRVSAAWSDEVASDAAANAAVGEGSLVALVLDDEGIEAAGAVSVRRLARAIVDRLGDGDRMAVYHTLSSGRSQDFTRDRTLVYASIDRFTHGRVPAVVLGVNPGDTRRGDDRPERSAGSRPSNCTGVVEMLAQLARVTAEHPGRRKAAFVISEQIPAASAGVCRDMLLELYRDARRANLNVYPINPRGLAGMGDAEMRDAESVLGANASSFRQTAAERALADTTGGVALSQTSAFDENLDRIFSENRSYYLLGYQSTNASEKPGLRRIAVSVVRDGVTVRHRSGYSPGAAGGARRSDPRALSPIAAASAGLLPVAALALEVTAAPVRSRSGSAVLVVTTARPRLAGADVTEEILVRATLVNPRGEVTGSTERKVQARGSATAGADSSLRVPMTLDAAPGRYQVRIAASSRAAGTTGSVFLDVTVPDFDEAPLAMSGIWLGASGDPPSLALGDLGMLTPFAPSTRRVFRTQEDLEAATRIYSGARHAVIAVTCRIRDARADEVWSGRVSVDGGGAVTRYGALARCPVPLGRLVPGPYLLEVAAAVEGFAATRKVKFIIE